MIKIQGTYKTKNGCYELNQEVSNDDWSVIYPALTPVKQIVNEIEKNIYTIDFLEDVANTVSDMITACKYGIKYKDTISIANNDKQLYLSVVVEEE